MRELTRSNDPVFLSFLQAELGADGIEPLMLDSFSSGVLEPMNATAAQRVMVADEDYWHAWAVLEEAEGRVGEDTILDGRVTVLQPKQGFRAAIDPVILAACVPAENGDRVLDVGTGTGVAALALLGRAPFAWVEGVDVQPGLIALAERAAARNGLSERARFRVGDVSTSEPSGVVDHVMSNPPFLPAETGQRPKDAARALATVESTADLAAWIGYMVSALRDGGTFFMIHRAERIDEILAHLGADFGAASVLDLVPVDDGRPTKRAVVRAVKGATPADVHRVRLVLHAANGAYTAEAQAVLRAGASLPMS